MLDVFPWTVSASGLLEAMEGIAFVTDLDGMIVQVGRTRFDKFAEKEFGGSDLRSEKVVGQSLFEYSSEGPVRDMVKRIHRRVASGQFGSLTFEARCDAAKIERTILNSVRPIMNNGAVAAVLYQSITASEKMRPPVMYYTNQAEVKVLEERRTARQLHICSYCARVGLPFGAEQRDLTWVSGPEYYKIHGDRPVSVTHGICNTCYGTLDDALSKSTSGATLSLTLDP